jgi:hypothetical protein
MAILTTVPLHVCPSKKKKFAIGGSRAARAFNMSCPSIPPMTAQLGDHSCAAVCERRLCVSCSLAGVIWECEGEKEAYESISIGIAVQTFCRTCAFLSRRLDMDSSSLRDASDEGGAPCCVWYSQQATAGWL